MEKALNLAELVGAHREKVEQPGTLSAKGIEEELRSFAAKQAAPELRRSQLMVAKARAGLDERRKALAVQKVDQSDLAGAILRSELRAQMRSMSLADLTRLALHNPDAITLAAIFEAPGFLSGVTDELREQVANAAFPQEVAAMDEEQEVLDVVGAALEISLGTVREKIGFRPDDRAFDAWMGEASQHVDREFEASGDKPAPADFGSVKDQALKLTSNDRFQLVDDLIAAH
jgi:hypothetical protein